MGFKEWLLFEFKSAQGKTGKFRLQHTLCDLKCNHSKPLFLHLTHTLLLSSLTKLEIHFPFNYSYKWIQRKYLNRNNGGMLNIKTYWEIMHDVNMSTLKKNWSLTGKAMCCSFKLDNQSCLTRLLGNFQ